MWHSRPRLWSRRRRAARFTPAIRLRSGIEIGIALSNHEKSALRAQAHAVKCSVTVGKSGLTQAVLGQIRHAFAGKELVKVRVQCGTDY